MSKAAYPRKLRISVPKSVNVRANKETRDRLHSIKNPGQTFDGIITQLIDLWEKVKKQEAWTEGTDKIKGDPHFTFPPIASSS